MDTFIITCEHGGNRVPAPHRASFRDQRELPDSHRGWDPGALVMANAMVASHRAPLVTSHLRRRFAQTDHVGIQLEVNRALVFAAGRRWTALRGTLIDSLHTAGAP
jgi:hypothetical protein